jgi:hypothetical protein
MKQRLTYRPNDVVAVRLGRYGLPARVIEAYLGPTGERVTIQMPAEPEPGVEPRTHNLSVADLDVVRVEPGMTVEVTGLYRASDGSRPDTYLARESIAPPLLGEGGDGYWLLPNSATQGGLPAAVAS